jgi:hypothetical protein
MWLNGKGEVGKHGSVTIEVFHKVKIFQDIKCNKKYVNGFKPMLVYAQLKKIKNSNVQETF